MFRDDHHQHCQKYFYGDSSLGLFLRHQVRLRSRELLSQPAPLRYLPIGDVMMISAIKPAIVTLLSCVFLKESCGAVEVLNLLLTLTGIFLVVQPSVVFGESSPGYTNHMTYTAIGLLLANILGSCINVIIRYMRHVHWTSLALSARLVTSSQMFLVCAISGFLCLPSCGSDRLRSHSH